MKKYAVPVFMVKGFLGSGKSTFVEEVVGEGQFDEMKKILLILCEEGEIELNQDFLDIHHMDVVVLEKEQFNVENFQRLEREYEPWTVLIECNGMWESDLYKNMTLAGSWEIYQEVTLINAGEFDLYWSNMKVLMVDTILNSDMVIFNRCKEEMDLPSFKRSVQSVSNSAQVIFENCQGEIISIQEELPYDIEADEICIEESAFGIWYLDVMNHPENYLKKKVKFKGQVMMSDRFPNNYFVPGRLAMTCCEDDTGFIGFLCKSKYTKKLKSGQWVNVEAEVGYEYQAEYGRKGPVLNASNVELTEPAKEKYISF